MTLYDIWQLKVDQENAAEDLKALKMALFQALQARKIDLAQKICREIWETENLLRSCREILEDYASNN